MDVKRLSVGRVKRGVAPGGERELFAHVHQPRMDERRASLMVDALSVWRDTWKPQLVWTGILLNEGRYPHPPPQGLQGEEGRGGPRGCVNGTGGTFAVDSHWLWVEMRSV